MILLVPFEMVDNGIAFFDKSIDTGCCCCDGRVMTTSDGDDASAFISSENQNNRYQLKMSKQSI